MIDRMQKAVHSFKKLTNFNINNIMVWFPELKALLRSNNTKTVIISVSVVRIISTLICSNAKLQLWPMRNSDCVWENKLFTYRTNRCNFLYFRIRVANIILIITFIKWEQHILVIFIDYLSKDIYVVLSSGFLNTIFCRNERNDY